MISQFFKKLEFFHNIAKIMTINTIKIGTHDGKFHCDEVLACYLLKCLPEYEHATIIRTRKEPLLDTCDIVVDVGGVHDYEKLRFDHHQKSFDNTLNSILPNLPYDKIKLSSAGLVYAYFGKRIIDRKINLNNDSIEDKSKKQKLDECLNEYIYKKIYENLIQEIDAIDNGIEICDSDKPKKYKISTNLSSRVSYLNPAWNEPQKNPDEQFEKAMALVGPEFDERVRFYAHTMWPAREIVRRSFVKRFSVCDSGEILLLDQYAPWQDMLYEIEELDNVQPLVKYVIIPTDSPTDWRVQCVSIGPGSFQNRLSLPEAWRGLRNEELSTVSKIPDCVFVHMTGFIGGNKTKEGAIAMAKAALHIGEEDHNKIP